MVVKEDVDKPFKAGFIKEARYLKWSQCRDGEESNRRWTKCVDYIDLNKACPKDSFPLLRID